LKKEYILAIDCGTQSVRALIFDKKGELIGKKKVEFEPYFSEFPGWAEQDPELYFTSACAACKGLQTDMPEEWDNIIGVTLTTQRDTGVNVDIQGKALRPAIIWLDQRMAACVEPLKLKHRLMFSAIGMGKASEITRKKSKCNWIKENQPEVWSKTYKYLLLSGFLTFKFTGKMVDSIASQIGHVPFDYKNKCFIKSENNIKWGLFGIEIEKLPELFSPGTIISKITKEVSELTGIKEGIPFIAAGSDKGCETLGTGCVNVDSASLSFGTTATVQTTSKYYIEPIQFMPAYPAVMPGCYNPEVEIFRGYWMISWFKKEFCLKEVVEATEKGLSPEILLNERLDDIPPGSQGLMLQPFWGAGLKMPEAKGAIIGFGDVHTRAHIYRAIIEGINYGLIEGVEQIEAKTKTKIEKLMVSGGGSQSASICQITADMFNRPVYKGETYESSGLGAAIVGFVGLGIYNSFEEAVKNMVRYSEVFEPSKEHVETYNKLYNKVYKKIYPRLKVLYHEIQEITKYPEI
jgi:sugar (pentulose or hexulose) kinase